MANISQSQAKLLASEFLDTIGGDKGKDLQVNESLTALIMLAGNLIDEANNNLQQGGHISSGRLSDSIKALDPRIVNGWINIDIEALFYYLFIDAGVKGTKSGSGAYSFKTSYPSKKMVTEIQKWIKRAGLSTYNVKKPVSNLERKRKSISQLNTGRRTAYAVATSIKQKGIRATNFFSKAADATELIAQEQLGKAFAIDVINSLPNSLDEIK